MISRGVRSKSTHEYLSYLEEYMSTCTRGYLNKVVYEYMSTDLNECLDNIGTLIDFFVS